MKYHAGNALRSDLVLLPLDDEVVAFSEAAQGIIGLNAAAAGIVNALRAGKPAAEIVAGLAAQGAEGSQQAEEWLDGVLEVLGSGGFLADGPIPLRAPGELTDGEGSADLPADMPPHRRFNVAVEQRYRLVDTCALIRFRDRAQARMVNSVIGHLATDEDIAPTLVMDIWATRHDNHVQSYIYCDGVPTGYAPRLSLVSPIVKGLLWRSAINAHPFLFYIHAGVIGAANGCVLFPAAPGSGKSSLTAALTASGFRYLSDEVALVETTEFDVRPMPLAFCAKRSGWDVMARYFPGILDVPTHRRLDNKDVRYIAPPPHSVEHASWRASHIIFPRYNADAETRLIPVARADALRRLMDECLALRTRLNREHVQKLIDALSRIDCYALTFSSLDEAIALVSDAVGAPLADAINHT